MQTCSVLGTPVDVKGIMHLALLSLGSPRVRNVLCAMIGKQHNRQVLCVVPGVLGKFQKTCFYAEAAKCWQGGPGDAGTGSHREPRCVSAIKA